MPSLLFIQGIQTVARRSSLKCTFTPYHPSLYSRTHHSSGPASASKVLISNPFLQRNPTSALTTAFSMFSVSALTFGSKSIVVAITLLSPANTSVSLTLQSAQSLSPQPSISCSSSSGDKSEILGVQHEWTAGEKQNEHQCVSSDWTAMGPSGESPASRRAEKVPSKEGIVSSGNMCWMSCWGQVMICTRPRCGS
jgi:hypothetical protein